MSREPQVTPEPAPAARPRILALANQKGGVGKTTTAINLGTALAAVGERVLIVDLDPQGNASTGLGIERDDSTTSTYEVLLGDAGLESAIVPSSIPRMDCVPSSMDLLGAELELAQVDRRTHRLFDAIEIYYATLEEHEERPRFTYILLDCPPSLNLLTINAMSAADAILVSAAVRVLRARRLEPAFEDCGAGQGQPQSETHDTRHRAYHVRPPELAVRPGGRRRALIPR